jgi:hypothetical protein
MDPIYDPVAEEIYEIRQKMCEECGYDFDKLTERYKRRQEMNPERLVSHVPKAEPMETVGE